MWWFRNWRHENLRDRLNEHIKTLYERGEGLTREVELHREMADQTEEKAYMISKEALDLSSIIIVDEMENR